MKGIGKAFARTPHMIGNKVGMSKKSSDPEFDDLCRRFVAIETATEKLIKDTKKFIEAVTDLFTHGSGWAEHFTAIFNPISGEYDLLSKHPDVENTLKNVDAFQAAAEELQSAVIPELELIESRILAPVKELQGIEKLIRKSITKREHKLVDYDRFNNSLTKLRDKKEKSLNDEKNLFKLEQDFEIATNEYEYINTAMKTDLPRFMMMATQFIDPLFHSFFYMQLNIFYILMEKINSFAEGNYEVSVPAAQIADDYEARRTDAWQRIEELNITKRMISTSKFVQSQRVASGGPPSVGRSVSVASSTGSGTGPSSQTSPGFVKKAPAPPSLSAKSSSANLHPHGAPPPPYSPSSNSSTTSAFGGVKKAPPPPPPLKPKPKPAEPAKQYVVALYDFEAQAEGDLEFRTGERIEVVERTESTEDWWTGRLNGRQGVFPGNYVQDA